LDRIWALTAQPAAQHVVVRRHDGGGHQLGAQRGGFGGVGHPVGDELAEQPLVAATLAISRSRRADTRLVSA
jgi:hypothetical protein